MWDVLVRTPRGSNNPRKFSLLLTMFFMACFAYIIAATPTAYAADATWEGENIVNDGNTFTPVDSSDTLPSDVKASPAIYQYVDEAPNPDLVYFIYFAADVTDPKNEKEATYIRYTLNPPNRYLNPSNKQAVTLTPAAATTEVVDSEQEATSCAVENIGWLVCGVGGMIAEGIDTVYRLVSAFLTVQPLLGAGDNGLYNLWDIMRNFANVLFVIGFLVVIYSYLAGGGFNGYEVRKIIPRVVLAAILINLSYWICSLAIDASNIIGVSLQDLLVNIRETSVATSENRNVTWDEITTYILSGGTIGLLGFFAATGGSITSLAFLLLIFLITVVFSLFVAFIILAARQAIIIILVILAPLAFAAFILPNTEKWFDRWRTVFTTMLMLFPIFSLLFGGSQLAGAAIIQNAPDNEAGLAIMLFGMGVQIIPLVITPLLIQFSGNLLGRIAGVVNNAERGLMDRSKGWATNRSEFYKDRALSNDNKWYNFARRGGQRMYQKDVARQKRQEAYKKMAENRAHEREFGTGAIAQSRIGRAAGLPERLNRNSYGNWDGTLRDANLTHQRIDAEHDKHWKERSSIMMTDPNDPSKRIRNQHFDQTQLDQRIALQTAQDKGQLADERFNTAYANMKAGIDPYQGVGIGGPSTQSVAAQVNAVQATARDLTIEANRKASAEVVIQQAGAAALKDSLDLRTLAGGIGGDMAANRIYAKAKVEVVSAYLDDVKNSRSLLSEYSANELIRLSQQGVDRSGKMVEDNHALRDAAQQEILLTKGNNWAFQKEKDYVAVNYGMNYDETSTVYDANGEQVRYFKVRHDAQGNALKNPDGSYQRDAILDANGNIDQNTIDRNRDVQQMFVDGVKNSKLKIANISGTDRSDLETGTFVASNKDAIIRDAAAGKIKPDRWSTMDYDEMMRTVQLLRENGDGSMRKQLDVDKLQAISDNINLALTDPRLSVHIEDRQKVVLEAIQRYAQAGPGDLTPAQMQSIEGQGSIVPREYDYTKPYEYSDPKGPA